jgi:hypothetical protein
MIRKLLAVAFATGLMAAMVGGAAADHNPSHTVTQWAEACEARGGTYIVASPTVTCFENVVTPHNVKVAGKSGLNWTIETTSVKTTTVTYVFSTGTLTYGPAAYGPEVVTGCSNPAGQPVDPATTDQCRLP